MGIFRFKWLFNIKEAIKGVLPLSIYNMIKPIILWIIELPRVILFPFAYAYLWLLNLKQPTKITKLCTPRIGNLALNTDLDLRQKDTLYKDIKLIFLAPMPIANEFILNRWCEIANVIRFDKRPIYGFFLNCARKFDNKFIFRQTPIDKGWELYLKHESVFYFTESEKKLGDELLQEMGITKNDWFVCVFARDNAYLAQTYPTWEFDSVNSYRDSDIETLNPSIQYILDKGGFVIRLGKVVAKAMSFKHPRVIDYPLSKWREGYNGDLLDLYMQYRAKFVLSSSTSGATDVCSLFGTPYCGANMPFNYNITYKNSISIPQKFRKLNHTEFISLNEWIDLLQIKHTPQEQEFREGIEDTYGDTFFFKNNNLEIINNSPEEILELVKEMFERLEGSFTQTEQDKQLQEKYQNINATYILSKDSKNPIGREFLRQNPWYLQD